MHWRSRREKHLFVTDSGALPLAEMAAAVRVCSLRVIIHHAPGIASRGTPGRRCRTGTRLLPLDHLHNPSAIITATDAGCMRSSRLYCLRHSFPSPPRSRGRYKPMEKHVYKHWAAIMTPSFQSCQHLKRCWSMNAMGIPLAGPDPCGGLPERRRAGCGHRQTGQHLWPALCGPWRWHGLEWGRSRPRRGYMLSKCAV